MALIKSVWHLQTFLLIHFKVFPVYSLWVSISNAKTTVFKKKSTYRGEWNRKGNLCGLRKQPHRSEAKNGRNMHDFNLLNDKQFITINYGRLRRDINQARSLGRDQHQGQLNGNMTKVSQGRFHRIHRQLLNTFELCNYQFYALS